MADLGLGDIVKSITGDVKQLVRDEVQLAKSELVPAAKNAGIGAGMFGAAGYFAICALSILYFAAAFGLATVMPTWLAFLIVGVVLLVIAAVLGLIGLTLVRKVKAPQRTIASANATIAELKAAVQRGSAPIGEPSDEIEGEVVSARAIS
jgi:ABC-type multidrug transport system fused ATPase/permease subunit